ncbi:conserved exported hypothetical protein [Candidatus Sulfopaludibacter sp. SbA3]|nr:conserved exported hypothetical protein [Candidatus Sulfopaludibacter sp. SbA3]
MGIRFLTLAGVVLASLSGAWAQKIEVASIKLSRDTKADSNFDSAPGGRLTATNITVRYLIRLAYAVEDYQVERTPAWVDGDLYDIAAKSSGGKTTSLEEERSVVRELLTDRFQLATHRETKQLPVYLLVVGKNGSKLTAHNDGSGAKTRKSCGHLAGTRVTADVIALMLARQFERNVLNQTGLPGKYDFQLDFTPDSGPCPVDSGQPSIFTAVQQQLGLKLESGKGPVETLVIDKVERPSEN